MHFTLQGDKPLELEVEKIYDNGPNRRFGGNRNRKVKDLHFYIKWREVKQGIAAKQPYVNVKGTAEDAVQDLAKCWNLLKEQFSKPNNTLLDS